MGPWKEKGQGLPTRACPLPVHPKAMRAKLSETLTCDQVGVAPIKPLPPPPQCPQFLGESILLGVALTLAVQDNLPQSRPWESPA